MRGVSLRMMTGQRLFGRRQVQRLGQPPRDVLAPRRIMQATDAANGLLTMAELDVHLGQFGPQVIGGEPTFDGTMKGGIALLRRHSERSGMAFQLHGGLRVPVVDQDTAAIRDRRDRAAP